ncbi:MAG TPA: phosphate acetyltransferase [Acidobacteriota bacterium]|nr:phosphate acetyltransferase [Acidobacteriota bacterium]
MPFTQVHVHKKRGDILDKILQTAKSEPQRIIFPEGTEPRILQALVYLVKHKILTPILVGNEKEILKAIIHHHHPELKNVTIIDPQHFPALANELYELRKDKGMTIDQAKELTKDPVWAGMMLLKRGDADGLICGAMHKTAETLKPAFTIIKTKPGVAIASSYFLMLVDSQVYFYADCAVNPDPSPEQLADIAITTADTAKSFGYEPKVAMLSFATHNSAQHPLVDKVQKATDIILQRRPDIIVDGPVQFDTAVVPDVAQKKAPQSPIKGNANVLVFPNLDVGNIAYKITQRFAHAKPVGPMLQGLNKPVNDLSIGCTIEEIIETAALTAVQAITEKKK